MIYFLSLKYFKTVFVGLEPVRIENVTWKEKCTNRTLYSKIIPSKPRDFVGIILISGLYVEQLAVILILFLRPIFGFKTKFWKENCLLIKLHLL